LKSQNCEFQAAGKTLEMPVYCRTFVGPAPRRAEKLLCRFADARLSSPEHPQRQRLEEAAAYSPGTAIVAGAFFLSRIAAALAPGRSWQPRLFRTMAGCNLPCSFVSSWFCKLMYVSAHKHFARSAQWTRDREVLW
jgi:hypothetical protein